MYEVMTRRHIRSIISADSSYAWSVRCAFYILFRFIYYLTVYTVYVNIVFYFMYCCTYLSTLRMSQADLIYNIVYIWNYPIELWYQYLRR